MPLFSNSVGKRVLFHFNRLYLFEHNKMSMESHTYIFLLLTRWMKNVRQFIWMLSFFMLLMLAGCHPRELPEGYPLVVVQVGFNWDEKEGAGSLPEGMRVIFYPKDAEGCKVDVFLPVGGGEVKLPPGRYAAVVFNYDTETVLIRGEEAYETVEAYTNPCRPDMAGTEKMVWGPDALYTAKVDDFEARDTDEPVVLEVEPRLVVETRRFNLKAERLDNVGSAWGSLEGMADRYLLGKGCGKNTPSPIYFDVGKGDGALKGSFTTFGLPDGMASRAAGGVKMKLVLIKIDRSVQTVEVDITQAVSPPGNEGDEGPAPVIELPAGSVIKVDEVAVVPGGGGIDGDVGEWGDETEVELPID